VPATSQIATVVALLEDGPEIQRVRVRMPEGDAEAVVYPRLVGRVVLGDEVLLNTAAVRLRLGSGGVHFVTANFTRPQAPEPPPWGHIVKGRYLPHQLPVLAVEEPASPHHAAFAEWPDLGGTPVILAELHSQMAAAAVAFHAVRPGARLVYVMPDTAALPLPFSRLVAELRAAGVLAATVTCGQAWGGDHEAVTLPSALQAAVAVAGAEAVIVAQGPGNAGTGTAAGFSGLALGDWVNHVASVNGRPIVVLRASAADSRERHRGVSHHTVTALARIALAPATVAVPLLSPEEEALLASGLAAIPPRHTLARVDTAPAEAALEEWAAHLRTMGRGLAEEDLFFRCGAASGLLAAAWARTSCWAVDASA
jgi:hypothetical protein